MGRATDQPVETVIFNGVTFRRYPMAKSHSDRMYYSPSIHIAQQGVGRLHEEVWKLYNGPIPPGHEIHHKDFDSGNNDPSNLDCITVAEHRAIHAPRSAERGRQSDRLEHLERIRPLTVAWHGSAEGKAWHAAQASASLKARASYQCVCDQCGSPYESKSIGGNLRFCSNKCKSAWRRASGVDDEVRTCAWCSATFLVNKYSKTDCCSRSCAGRRARGSTAAGL